MRNYHHVLREKIVKTLTPEELLGLTDIEGSALSRNLGAEVYIPSHVKDYHHKSCIALSFLFYCVSKEVGSSLSVLDTIKQSFQVSFQSVINDIYQEGHHWTVMFCLY